MRPGKRPEWVHTGPDLLDVLNGTDNDRHEFAGFVYGETWVIERSPEGKKERTQQRRCTCGQTFGAWTFVAHLTQYA